MRIAVVGAGACGLTTLKTCIEYRFEVQCFEKTDDLAGIWRYRNDTSE